MAFGLGAQRIVQDLLAGFFIITELERQYGFGDLIRVSTTGVVSDATGTVEEVNLRITRLRSVDGEVIIVPNGQIWRTVNLSRDWARAVIDIPVPATVDVGRASGILQQVGAGAYADPELRALLLGAPTVMGVERMEIDEFRIRLVARTLPGKQFGVGRELCTRVAVALRREGIVVPADLDTAPPTAARRDGPPCATPTAARRLVEVGAVGPGHGGPRPLGGVGRSRHDEALGPPWAGAEGTGMDAGSGTTGGASATAWAAGSPARRSSAVGSSEAPVLTAVPRRPHTGVATPLGLTDLSALVHRVAAEVRAGRHEVRIDPARRWYRQLHSDGLVDVWLISWATEQTAELHDHAGSRGAVAVVSGVLTERRWVPAAGDLQTRQLGAGQGLSFPLGYVHDVANAAPEPAVSVHAYSPPLSVMSYYTLEQAPLRGDHLHMLRRTRTVLIASSTTAAPG